MSNSVLVTGGSGNLGSALVEILAGAGSEVRILSRQARAGSDVPCFVGDLRSGDGVDEAVQGVDVVVHCASRLKDAAMASNLVDAMTRSGRAHLVYISIVGIERVPLGYYKQKLAAEQEIEGSDLPWTILRTTQFHDLIFAGCRALSRPPVMVVPAGARFQPIDVHEVAERLSELALGPVRGRVEDMGGPEILSADDLARAFLEASGRRRGIVRIRLPGAAMRGVRDGGLLAPDHALGRMTFSQFLAGRSGPKRTS